MRTPFQFIARFRMSVIILPLLFFSFALQAQTGANDPTFNPTDIGYGFGDGTNTTVTTTAIQSDGKILVGGYFTIYNGVSQKYIMRLNTDGGIDQTFNSGSGFNNSVGAIAIRNDGKIVVGGSFSSYNGTSINGIARLNEDGSLDTSFDPGTGPDNYIALVRIQVDGKILIGGGFTTYNGTARNRIARLNLDGSLDASFDPGAGPSNFLQAINIQSTGKILVGGWFTNYNGTNKNYLVRLNADGSPDATFNTGAGPDAPVRTIVFQEDGKITIGGGFSNYNGVGCLRVARLNEDGSLDFNFNPNQAISGGGDAYTIAVQSDGKFLLGGSFSISSSVYRDGGLVRLNADGSFDPTFIPLPGATYIATIAIQSDGKVIIGGNFVNFNSNRIARLDANGSVDNTFNTGTGANGQVNSCAVQGDGKIIIAGDFTSYNGIARNRIARLNGDGSLDASFDPGGGTTRYIRHIALQPDGKIIIGGMFELYNWIDRRGIARLNVDGSLDLSFDPGSAITVFGELYSIAVQTDGKIIIGGHFTQYNGVARSNIARLNPDGSLDEDFDPGTGTDSEVITIAIQSDGKVMIGGLFSNYNGTARNKVARLNSNGSLDEDFNPGTGVEGGVAALALQSNGKVLVSGSFFGYNDIDRKNIARLNTDGSLDMSFNPGTGANYDISTIAIQSDGKIVIGGSFTSYNSKGRNRLARLNPDGSLDLTFDPGSGPPEEILTCAIQTDGKVVIGGFFTSYYGTGRNRVARVVVDCSGPTIPTLNASSLITCSGQSSILSVISGSLNHATNWKWYSGSCGGILVGTGSAITISPSTTTTYFVRGEGGCVNPGACANITISVNPLPVVGVTVSPAATVCPGTMVTLNATGGIAYSWTGGITNGLPFSPSGTFTYVVTGTDANGCSTTAQKLITVNPNPPQPVITPGGPLTFCQGGSVTLTSSSPTGNIWSNGSNSKSITVTSSGTYLVTVNALGCSSTSANTLVVVSSNPPKPTISGGALTFCEGGTVVLTTSATGSHKWSTGATTKSITVSQSATLRDTAISGSCKVVSNPVTINVMANPAKPMITGGPLTFCQGGSVVLTTSATGSHKWSTGATTLNITLSQSGTVRDTAISGSCKTVSDPVTVNVLPNPAKPVITGGPLTFCEGGSVLLSTNALAGHKWNTGATSTNITVSSSGTFVDTAILGTCKVVSDPVVVSVISNPPTPTISASGPLTFCQGGSVTLTSSSASGNTWNNGETTPGITVTNPGNYAVTVGANGCSATSATTLVFVNPNPSKPTISGGPLTFCEGGSVVLTTSATGSHKWSNGATTQSISLSNSATIRDTAILGSCKTVSDPVTVNVMPNPAKPVITGGPLTFCQGGSVLLSTNALAGHKWNTGATSTNITVSSSGTFVDTAILGTCKVISDPVIVSVISNPPTPTISAGGPLTFCQGGSVTLTSSSPTGNLWSNGASGQSITVTGGVFSVTVGASGCSSTSTNTVVTANPNPSKPTISGGPLTFCAGGSILLSTSALGSHRWSTGATTPGITLTSSGTFADTAILGSCKVVSDPVVITVNPNPAKPLISGGPLTFCEGGSVVLSTNATGSHKWNTGETFANILVTTSGTFADTAILGTCKVVSDPVVVVVNPNPLIPTISANGPLTFCEGGSVTLTSSSPAGNLWSNGSSGQSITVTGGVFSVTVGASGCSSTSASTLVTSNPNPSKPTISGGPLTFCAGGSVLLSTSAVGSHRWSTGAATPGITVTTSGTFADTAILGTCKVVSDPKVVTVNPNPIVSAGADVTINAGQSTTLTASGAVSFQWSPLTGLNPANGIGASVVASPSGTTTYTVTGTSLGCVGTDQVKVTVNPAPTQTAAMPVITPGTGTYASSQMVTISSSTPGAVILYTLTGNTPVAGTGFTFTYLGPFLQLQSATVKAIATKAGLLNSTTASAILTITNSSVVGTPVINPPTGTYPSTLLVSITTATAGAQIYYTTNGNTPVVGTGFTILYTSPIQLIQSATIKAIALKTGLTTSGVATSVITITDPGITDRPVINPNGGTFTGSANVSISCPMAGAQIYYTTTGNIPVVGTTFTKLYAGPFSLFGTTTVRAMAVKTGKLFSPVVAANFVVISPNIVAAPTFNPAPGNYPGLIMVTLASTTSSTQIYYTTNGVTPNNTTPSASLYTGPFAISKNMTVRAIAYRTGYQTSTISIGNYTFGPLRVSTEDRPLDFYYEQSDQSSSSASTSRPSADSEFEPPVSIYPNPASEKVIIQYGDGKSELSVFNTLGMMYKKEIGSGEEVSLKDFPNGMYLFRISLNGKIRERTIIKR